jgi:predicted esterase
VTDTHAHEHHITVERSARYVTLGPRDGTAREIWFVLHGYGQLAADFIQRFASLDDGTRAIVAPEALNRFYLVGVEAAPAVERPVGATWMTKEDRLSEINDYVSYLDAVAARELQPYAKGATQPRVVVLGFSQGAATASRWIVSGAIRPAHIVLWGGFLPPDVDPSSAPLAATSFQIVHGSRDRFLSAERLAEEERRLREHGFRYRLVRYEGGHGIVPATLGEVARSLGAAVPNE